jgi:hypothetical protein
MVFISPRWPFFFGLYALSIKVYEVQDYNNTESIFSSLQWPLLGFVVLFANVDQVGLQIIFNSLLLPFRALFDPFYIR